jgi:hypothetical protein
VLLMRNVLPIPLDQKRKATSAKNTSASLAVRCGGRCLGGRSSCSTVKIFCDLMCSMVKWSSSKILGSWLQYKNLLHSSPLPLFYIFAVLLTIKIRST